MSAAADIGIVGGGVSALHLGLSLVTRQVGATIYTPLSATALANGKMQNTVAHMPDTVQRERDLGIDFWDESSVRTCRVRHYSLLVGEGQAADFSGNLNGDERCIDYRMYLPKMMAEFERRGGTLIHQAAGPADIDELYERHPLIAIAAGKGNGGFADYFPKIEALSEHKKPPRELCVGLYRGVADRNPLGVTVGISPGHGEIVVLPMETRDGPLMALLFENRSDGAMADLPGLDYASNPDAFNRRILQALEKHYPTVHAHVDQANFALVSDKELLQGSFTPLTRHSWCELRKDKYAIAIGDLRCTQDPLTGQGANLASRGACVLADKIVASDQVFDNEFCEAYEAHMRPIVEGTIGFNNAMLEPKAHTQQLLGKMIENEAICTDFSSRFAAPETIWFDILRDAETCAAYLNGFETDSMQKRFVN